MSTLLALTDDEIERILWLILREVDGQDVADALAAYSPAALSKFRTIVVEAKMVRADRMETTPDGEKRFVGMVELTPRGRKRLDEMNEKLNRAV
jgi:hypothetical protein